jgi:SHS2 domain-containing protein
MPYRFIEDVAIADVAFEAEGRTLVGLFEEAASALTATMVKDPDLLEADEERAFSVRAGDREMLLFQFLQELVFLKDAELLLFSRCRLRISREGAAWVLEATVRGERISPERQELLADVKAVSLHRFSLGRTTRGWKASVILDV